MIPGVDFGEFQQALVDGFDPNTLEMFARIRLNLRLDRIVKPGSFDYVVFQLLTWAEQQGPSVVVDLARAAYLERPDRPQVRRIYEKFGLAPEVSLQDAGTAVAGAPTRATGSRFEAIVRPRLRAVDMAVWNKNMAQVEGRVCRIESNGHPMGTGFLVAPDLVLTNYHVLEKQIEGKLPSAQVACRFDYKVLADGSRSEGVLVRLHGADWNVDSSPYSQADAANEPGRELPTADELDYALARLERPAGSEPVDRNPGPGAPARGWIALPEIQPPLEKGMPLLIVEHPEGAPLKFAIDTDSVLDVNANGTRVRYTTNTARGSSGSPCFNMDWELVALHHVGDPTWGPKFNQGVPIGVIRKRLAGKVQVQTPR
jgi:trypsin-like peptidase/effector-associated domain 1 (EAD1)-containing protein